MASRARRRVQGADRDAAAADQQVVDAFLAAARRGDFEQLLELLDPDVVLRGDDGSGALRIIQGAREVAAARGPSRTAGRTRRSSTGCPASSPPRTACPSRCSPSRSSTAGSRRSTGSSGPARIAGLGLEAIVGEQR